MQTQISAGTIDAPSWATVRVSKLAARIYAPLGTQMALSDFVRVWRVFADTFSGTNGMRRWKESEEPAEWSSSVSTQHGDMAEDAGGNEAADETTDEEEFLRQREELAKDLSVGLHPSLDSMGLPPLTLF
jgi:glycerol-3-phosphate O-acyltransferase/dihydroxyacetone phosphate acyltransferase